MRSISSLGFLLLALGLFGFTVFDIASSYRWVSLGLGVLVVAAALVALTLVGLAGRFKSRPVTATLLVGCVLACAVRLGGFEAVALRSVEDWRALHRQFGHRLAQDVGERFAALCRRAGAEAGRLASDPRITEAVGRPRSRDALEAAFERLEHAAFPSALPEPTPTAAVYDRWRNPLVWIGPAQDLSPLFASVDPTEEAGFAILEQGVFTHLLAYSPMPDSLGGVVVIEVPLVARRRINNRYLSDFDVINRFAGKSVSTDYVDVRETAPELARLFERSGDRYWGGSPETPVLHFPLRAPDETLLGVVSLMSEDPELALLEARRETQHIAGVIVCLAGLVTVVWLGLGLWRRHRLTASGWGADTWGHAALFIGSLWALRILVLVVDLRLGLESALDNPAHYASDAFFHFFRSPIDFMVTALVVLATTIVLLFPILSGRLVLRPRFSSPLGSFLAHGVARLVALGVLVLTVGIIHDAWVNSNLPLAGPGLLPFQPPLLAVQLGLAAFFLAAGAVSTVSFALAEMLSAVERPPSMHPLARYWIVDLVVVGGAYSLSFDRELAALILPALPVLLAFDALALFRTTLRHGMERGGFYRRLGITFLCLTLPILSFYPAIVSFEDRIVRSFIEETVAPAVLHHGSTQVHAMRETLRAVDRMELPARLDTADRDQLAYQIWSGSDLSVFALSSSVELYDERGALVSRFALDFPYSETDWHGGGTPTPVDEWIIEEESYPGEPDRSRVFHARRAFESGDGALWEIQVRVIADWSNLPFIETENPYLDLFRSPGTEAALPFPDRDLALHVFDGEGNSIFRSSEPVLTLGPTELERAAGSPRWMRLELGGIPQHVLLFTDDERIFALSYPGKPVLGYAAETTGWVILAGAVAFAVVLLAMAVGSLGGPVTFHPGDIWLEIGTSFYGKLFVAFILLALIPIVSLAFLVSGILVQQLQRDVEQEGMARARVVERFVQDYLLYQRTEADQRGVASVTDALLELVSGLVEADVDLFSRGELVATSERELFAAGLLSTRADPSVYRDLVLQRSNHSIHHESVGAFEYLVVSVPITLERWGEPGILSIPLASRQREIDRRVASLNQTVLLAALFFSLGAAALAYWLASRMANPINTLTATTKSVAQGDFDVSLETESRDEIGTLFQSFNRMTADLKRQREHLERSKKLEAWAEMARQVAHEVKNPLTPIQLSTEYLLRVYKDPNVNFDEALESCTDTILEQVKSLRQITMEFSTFASPLPVNREPTDFSKLVRDTIEPYRQAQPPGVCVELELDGALPRLSIDRRLIQRTLINLIDNALKAIDGRGKVTVTARPIGIDGAQWVELTVSDDGIGMDEETRTRIFEPYFSTRAAGTGLGLAIVRRAVDEHGGEVSVESEAGRGTRVVVKLPVEPSPVPASA